MSGQPHALTMEGLARYGRRSWRYLGLIGLAVYLGAIAYIGWRDVGTALRGIRWEFVAGLVLAEAGGLWVRVMKWRVALPKDNDYAQMCFLSKAGGNLSPGRIGELSPLLLRNHRNAAVGAWILVDRLLEAAGTLLIGLAGLFIAGAAGHRGLVLWSVGGLILLAVLTLCLAFAGALEPLARRLGHPWLNKSASIFTAVGRETAALRRKTPLLAALTVVAKGFDLAVAYCLYAAFGFSVGFAVLALAQSVHAITSAVPLTPNATGIPYLAAAGVIHELAGVSPEVLAASVGLRFVFGSAVFWMGFAIALGFLRSETYRDQGALFDRLARGNVLYDYTRESLARLRALRVSPGRALDVGCGDGTISAALGADFIAGFDVSPRCARLARGRGVNAVVADARSGLPYADDAFDTVYCIDVLHHLWDDWDRLIPELTRVLKPDGEMVIVEPDARNPFVRWTQAPRSPIRVAPWPNEPAIDPAQLTSRLAALHYRWECSPIQIEGRQQERNVFPLWQRILKAPFVIALAWWFRDHPNKFAIVARKAAA